MWGQETYTAGNLPQKPESNPIFRSFLELSAMGGLEALHGRRNNAARESPQNGD